jgi:hypothetical protein
MTGGSYQFSSIPQPVTMLLFGIAAAGMEGSG